MGVCTHTPLRWPWNGGGVRECCLQGAAQHMLCEQRSDDRAQQSSSDPCCPPLPDPPQTSLSGSSCLPLPTAASGRGLWKHRRGRSIGESREGSWLSSPASGPLHLLPLPDFTQSLSLCRAISLDPNLPVAHHSPCPFRHCSPLPTLPPEGSPSSFQLSCCFAFTTCSDRPTQDPGEPASRCL